MALSNKVFMTTNLTSNQCEIQKQYQKNRERRKIPHNIVEGKDKQPPDTQIQTHTHRHIHRQTLSLNTNKTPGEKKKSLLTT